MSNNPYILKCRELLTVQIRINTITGALVLAALMLFLLPFLIYAITKSDYVTYPFLSYVAVAVLGIVIIYWYRTAKLYWTRIDLGELQRIDPIRPELVAHSMKISDFTYGELLEVLVSYENRLAATESNKAGDNNKFRSVSNNKSKWLKVALRPFRYFSLKLILLAITLAQIAVGWGVLPTVQELFTGHPLPSISIHMSVREILEQIVAPRAITIALLQAIKVMLPKDI